MPNSDKNKFSPPPSNIIIRTMEKDLKALQEGGGELSIPDAPEEFTPPPSERTFLRQELDQPTPTEPEPVAMPPPPTITPPESMRQIPQPAPKKPSTAKTSGSPKVFLWALGIPVVIMALGALGYFIAWPLLQNRFFSPAQPPITQIPTPAPGITPAPTPEASNIALAKPADKEIIINLWEISRESLLAEIEKIATTTASANTFKVAQIKGRGSPLSAKEVFQLMFLNSPESVTTTLGEAHSIFIHWEDANTARLGAYFHLRPDRSESARAAIREWETALPTDGVAFFRGTNPGAITRPFRDARFQNTPLRFALFANRIEINYGIAANTLIYTTSPISMHAAIERLIGAQ